jgi:hypothetical protein
MIKMVVEGQKAFPKVFCDQCEQVIDDAKKGNALWAVGDELLQGGGRIYFTHKQCNHLFEHTHDGQDGWAWMPLEIFPIQLSANLHLRWGDKESLDTAKVWAGIGAS